MMDVCCALIFHEGCLLAVQRGAELHHPFQWEFPGGKVEADESALACIIREINEELQLEIKPFYQLKTVIHHYPGKLVRLIPFICEIKNGRLALTEHIQHKWLTDQDLDLLNWQEADKLLIERNRNELLHWFWEYNHNCRKN